MTTTLTARGPEDLLAAVPSCSASTRSDSLVMLTFDAARSFHARVDLPPPDELTTPLAELVDALLEPVPCPPGRPRGVRRLQRRRGARGSASRRRCARGVRRRAGIGVVDVLRAHDGRLVARAAPSRVPPSAPMVRTTTTDHPFAAQAVFEGG